VLVLEPRQDYSDDRSWGFWARDSQPLAERAEHSWSRWQIGRAGEPPATCSASGWRYRYVRSGSVYAEARQAIEASVNVELRLGSAATALQAAGSALRVDTERGPLFAAQVIDTRPPAPEQRAGATLFQAFAGYELESVDACFEPSTVELMTELRCDSGGLVFSYVLPLSPHRALVELTRFSPRPLPRGELEAELDALIARRGWTGAARLRSEYAVLPMGLPAAPALPAGALRAGVAGGGLRAASGYGFLRIQAWADRCAAALARGGSALGHPPEPRLRRWMDAVFLQVLKREPERAPELFLRLARGVSGGAFVRFMSDCAGPLDYVQVMTALPPLPFLRAAFSARSLPAGAAH
jgi:lycopene beta-cyclase